MRNMKEPSEQLDEIARKVIGAAIQVHRYLGPGFLESVYEEALCIELQSLKIAFIRQYPFTLKYKSHVIARSRVDLLVEGELIVELKTVDLLATIHAAQLMSYLKATQCQLGLLINFNVPQLKQGIRRIILS